MNAWRAMSGLAAVPEDPTLSANDYLHSKYMVETPDYNHSENPASPYYTPQGANAGTHSNIWVTYDPNTADTTAVDTWMSAPLHAAGMIDPRLGRTGYAAYRNPNLTYPRFSSGFSLDVLNGNSNASGAYAQPVYFPGNNSVVPGLLSFYGEFPDPVAAGCPGYSYPTGLPAFIQLGGFLSTSAGANDFKANGVSLPHCVIDSSNPTIGSYLNARGMVIVIPQAPLVAGVNYTVSLTVNGKAYSWSFGASNSTSLAPGAPTNVTAVAGDTTATVNWAPPVDTGGNAILSYTVTPYINSTAGTPVVIAAPAITTTITGLVDGTTYWFTVAATNAAGTGPSASSYSVTPTSTAAPPARMTASSISQYQLPNSDGVTWQDMDANNLSLSFTPATDGVAIISANVDLWTANSGFNQDIGIWLQAGAAAASVVAWKESGGSAGTFSPNAAMLQTAIPVTATTAYSVKLDWKTNKPALGATVFAGAGPIATQYSQSRLTVKLIPSTGFASAVSTQQYPLNSDGVTWQDMDATNLKATLTPASDGLAVISANADLWTANSGFNQDIGVFMSVNGGADQLVGWKESGGSAGTFSPNAAFLQAVIPVTSGSTYIFKLKWKTNKPATGATIYAGAGPINALFSPTRLTVFEEPTSAMSTAVTNSQYSLSGSNGVTWSDMDGSGLLLTFTPAVTGAYLISANADLWTANSGYNQDLGIMITTGSSTTPTLLAWKESGGSAGTYSPNAAYLEAYVVLDASTSYTFKVVWKTNRPAAGTTIFAAAGPLPNSGGFSPTRLTLIPAS